MVHFLDVLYPLYSNGITKDELNQVAHLYIYHLAHFSHDLSEAYLYAERFFSTDRVIWNVLQSLATGNYQRWKMYLGQEKDYIVRSIMTQSQDKLLRTRITIMAMSYFTMKKDQLPDFLGTNWAALVSKMGLIWTEQDDHVVIRKRTK